MQKEITKDKEEKIRKIQMVDVRSQYLNVKDEIDSELQKVIDSCALSMDRRLKTSLRS